MRINMPMQFPGSEEQIKLNRATHDFYDWNGDGDARCMECDRKPWHISADWPCGFSVPRVDGTEEDAKEWRSRFAAYALAQAIAFMD